MIAAPPAARIAGTTRARQPSTAFTAAIVTADHGNCEQMWDYTLNAPHTAHTTNLVPYIFVQGPGEANPRTLPAGALCDVAPTLLGLLGLPPSKEMTGKRLV